MRRTIAIFLILTLHAVLFSCQKAEYRGPALDLNSDVTIKNFTIGSIGSKINDSTGKITITFPFGKDRTAVSPEVTVADGATVVPASGTVVNLTNPVTYKIANGNLSNSYTVIASEEEALLSFVVNGVAATIDNISRTISAVVPSGTNIQELTPTIGLSDGTDISPAAGQVTDFSNPVIYKVSKGGVTVDYTVFVSTPEKIAFLSIADSQNELANPDEKAAWNWLIKVNPEAQFVSFNALKNGTAHLNGVTVIWWHEDNTQDLPAIAFDPNVLSKLKSYNDDGGSFLLTSFGARYVEALGIVPAGKGTNNSFGDPQGSQWIEPNFAWGISFKGYATHPVFNGLTLTSEKPYPTAYLLGSGTFRLNHTAQWYIPDWGGYGTPENWRTQTGGIDLGSTEWDEDHNTAITMAEFPRSGTHGGTIVIGAGCYDWYSEPDPSNPSSQPQNLYLPNIEKLTSNTLKYLSK